MTVIPRKEEPHVTIIPGKDSARSRVTTIPKKQPDKNRTRVAVYCRVSTKAERQSGSLENQITHYTETIGSDPQYELVEIYYDFGISGYKADRPGFQRMMEDARKGRFSLVITKAITRFARNTQTVIEAARELKALGIGIFFELQNINTLSSAGELLMTLFAALGQAESEGARLHTLMSLKRRYESGNPPRRLEKSLGYSKGPDGEFYPDEYAPLVIEIFEMAADGYTAAQITNYLNAEGVKTHNGTSFHRKCITRILRNVAYKGDFIAQQYFVDSNRRIRKNNGEKTSYYIEEDHIPIVSIDLWEKAQEVLDHPPARKKEPTEGPVLPLTDKNYPYRHNLFCAKCGHRLMRAVRCGRVLWECSGKTKFGADFCSGVSVTDDEIRKHLASTQNLASTQDVDIGEARDVQAMQDLFIDELIEKGVVKGHIFTEGNGPDKKPHITSAPALTETNYPYMNRIFCKYCGSRLRRIINNNNTITWICNGASRHGKSYCKGIRVPDAKLKPLSDLSGIFYIGKEIINGKESYGYSRQADQT